MITPYFDLFVPQGPHPGWLARITGPSREYGFAREFLEPDGWRQDGPLRQSLYRLTPQHLGDFESCQSAADGRMLRLYYRAVREGDEIRVGYATPEQVFDNLTEKMAALFWPRWFGRYTATHKQATVRVRHKAGVGEVYRTNRSGSLQFYLTVWVPVWDEAAGTSDVRVCPIAGPEHEEADEEADEDGHRLPTFDLDRLQVGEKAELPRGDWD